MGNTKRPQGTGGAGRANLNLGQWAAKRYFGYNSSQIPPIDRPPAVGSNITTLLQDVGAGDGCEPATSAISVIAADALFLDPGFLALPIPDLATAASGGQSVTELQCRIEWGTGATFTNRMDLDIGAGFQMSLTAQVVNVALILPNGAVDLENQVGQLMPAGPLDPVTGLQGSFHTALVYATAIRDGAYTAQEWQLTRALFVPLGTTVRVAIPPGVDFVEANEISVPAGATPALNFQTGQQQAGVFLDVGQWSVSTSARRFNRVRIPGNARFIASGAVVPGADRLFLLRFTSRP